MQGVYASRAAALGAHLTARSRQPAAPLSSRLARAQVHELLERYRDMSGQRVRRFTQRGMGKTPSVQGEWSPYQPLDKPHEVVRG
jgi:hypothetical protein